MTLSTWWLFILMTFVVSATPGPNMLYVMSISARHGIRAAVMAMLGCMTALLAMMSISAAGLGALLHTFPTVFDALRLAGAAYLAWLCLPALKSGGPLAPPPGTPARPWPPARPWRPCGARCGCGACRVSWRPGPDILGTRANPLISDTFVGRYRSAETCASGQWEGARAAQAKAW